MSYLSPDECDMLYVLVAVLVTCGKAGMAHVRKLKSSSSFEKQSMPDRRFIKSVFYNLMLAIMVFIFSLTQFAYRVEHHLGLGLLYKLRGPVSPPQGALIVAIDRDTISWLRRIADNPKETPPQLSDCLPQSAWAELRRMKGPETVPRSLYACLLIRLKQYGFPVVAFDILFSSAGFEADNRMLARAIQSHGATALLAGLKHYTNNKGGVSVEIKREIQPLSIFKKNAAATGLFIVPGTGTPVYGYWRQYDGFEAIPSLIEETYNIYRKTRSLKRHHSGNLEKLSYLWSYGAPGTIATLSIRDVLSNTIPGAVQNRAAETVVFIGASDPNNSSFADTFPSWFHGELDANISGVELAATAFLNLKEGDQLKRPSWPLELLIIALFVILLALVARVSMAGTPLIIIGLAFIYLLGSVIAFSWFQLFLPVSIPLYIAAPLALLIALLARSSKATQLSMRLAPKPIARRLLSKSDEKVKVVSNDATVVFIDIIGSTSIGEQLSDLDFGLLINAFYDILIKEIESRRGLVIAFTGDGASAIFDDAHTGQGHTLNACHAVISIIQNIRALNAQNMKQGIPALGLRVGINSGPAAVGEIGGQDRFNFSIVGDTANLASRLEQLGKVLYPGEVDIILVGSETYSRVGHDLHFEDCGPVDIKGRKKRERIFRLCTD